MKAAAKAVRLHALRVLALIAVCFVSLQLFFLLRVALMIVIDPQSTTFQRSEAWRLLTQQHQVAWAQQWVDDARISPNMKRAVIASEDASFAEHSGVDWDAIEKAWDKNQRAEERARKAAEALDKREASRGARTPASTAKAALPPKPRPVPKVIGGSTITQQLAKNLFLGGERNILRKGQEFAITFMLEGLLGKRRILEIYLNNVEWGEGVFGAQAAANHYYGVNAAQLAPQQAARLAVMLPAPKRFEKRPASPYVAGRGATIAARMGSVEVP